MTETPESKPRDEPAAPTPKRHDAHVGPAETEPIPPSARVDYLAPDGSVDAGEDAAERGSDRKR